MLRENHVRFCANQVTIIETKDNLLGHGSLQQIM